MQITKVGVKMTNLRDLTYDELEELVISKNKSKHLYYLSVFKLKK